jgi:hypothetical protein
MQLRYESSHKTITLVLNQLCKPSTQHPLLIVSNWPPHWHWTHRRKTCGCWTLFSLWIHDNHGKTSCSKHYPFLFLLQSDTLSPYVACHRYCYGILWRKGIVSFFLSTLYAFSKWISDLIIFRTVVCLILHRPFFFTTIPGAAVANGDIAKQVRKTHWVIVH